MSDALRVANCSGFYGDRLEAAREMVEGGPIDVLTGDYLAELTMLILAKRRARRPGSGYAATFLEQLEHVMATCLREGIKVVSNAGGLEPEALAADIGELARRLGLSPRVATVEGDDLLDRMDELMAVGEELRHADTGESPEGREMVTANAYLGGFGIAEALRRGADVVVTGRVADASLVLGPAAWHHGWCHDDLDALAGAVVAGHVLECGCQATGGNFAFFSEVPGLEHPGFPLAEVASDGSSVITKHPGQGGLVSVETVTAQLLYEIGGRRYLNPDVTARFDTIELAPAGPDRVRISGVRGEPPPPRAKVAMNYLGGHATTVTMVLTGLDVEEKAAAFERALWPSVGGREAFDSAEVELLRTDRPDPPTNAAAMALLRLTVRDRDESKVGRAFSAKVTELALASYPGLFSAGARTSAFGEYWPTSVGREHVTEAVELDGERFLVPRPGRSEVPRTEPPACALRLPASETAPLPLGRVAGARSGDKGGDANIGVWARSAECYAWLAPFLTTERLLELCEDISGHRVERCELPNLRAVNFVVRGLLGRGVASSSRLDGQAKALGEYLRAKVVDVPVHLHPR